MSNRSLWHLLPFQPRRPSPITRVVKLSLMLLVGSPFSAPFSAVDAGHFNSTAPITDARIKPLTEDSFLRAVRFDPARPGKEVLDPRRRGTPRLLRELRARHVVLRL